MSAKPTSNNKMTEITVEERTSLLQFLLQHVKDGKLSHGMIKCAAEKSGRHERTKNTIIRIMFELSKMLRYHLIQELQRLFTRNNEQMAFVWVSLHQPGGCSGGSLVSVNIQNSRDGSEFVADVEVFENDGPTIGILNENFRRC